MIRQTGGSAIVAALEAHGVNVVFGIPGTHNLEIYRGLAASGIRHVSMRHEQGAGYAADGYARISGRPGVCVTTSGPGLTNILTAVATAWSDSVPLLIVAPGPARGEAGGDRGRLHEMRDQLGTVSGVVESAIRVDSIEGAIAAVDKSFASWALERPRPRYVEVPVDVLSEHWIGSIAGETCHLRPDVDLSGESALIVRAAEMLSSAKCPVVVVGGGARSGSKEILALVELLVAPAISTINGKGIVPESHDLSLGSSLRLPSAKALIASADVAILIGTELGDSDLWGDEIAFTGAVIRVDIDFDQLNKNVRSTVAIHGDAGAVVASLISKISTGVTSQALVKSERKALATVRSKISQEALIDGESWFPINAALHAKLAGEVVVVGDSSQVSYYGTAHFWPMGPNERFLYPTGYATLGYGIPAAVGAKIANPSAKVIALVGDGGFMFTVQDLMSASELGMGIPVVVMNNGGYREIRDGMLRAGIQPIGVDLAVPDFAMLGRAFGGYGVQVSEVDEAASEVERALERSAPTVIELRQ